MCVADKCKCCDADIYVGEQYYDVEGVIICEACINEYRKTMKAKEVNSNDDCKV